MKTQEIPLTEQEKSPHLAEEFRKLHKQKLAPYFNKSAHESWFRQWFSLEGCVVDVKKRLEQYCERNGMRVKSEDYGFRFRILPKGEDAEEYKDVEVDEPFNIRL